MLSSDPEHMDPRRVGAKKLFAHLRALVIRRPLYCAECLITVLLFVLQQVEGVEGNPNGRIFGPNFSVQASVLAAVIKAPLHARILMKRRERQGVRERRRYLVEHTST